MRVGVLGGSFHPPHVGHAMVAAWLRWVDRVDEVWLVPVADHAFGKVLPPLAERAAWCRALAERVGPWVRVSEIEAELPTPSYTWRTLEALSARYPEHDLRLVVGADVLPTVDRWHRWPELAAKYRPIVVSRSGHPPVDGCPPLPAVSSTEIRALWAEGKPVDHLVPAAVLALMGRSR